ncbi:MAG: RidA family protein [Bacteroidota bacterium]
MSKTHHSIAGYGKAGPYSHIVEANGFVFLSGVIPLPKDADELISGSIEDSTHQVMQNIGALLEQVGCTYSDIVKATIFMLDMQNYGSVNTVYASYFEGGDAPARSAMAVKTLPMNAPVEIEVIALKPQ